MAYTDYKVGARKVMWCNLQSTWEIIYKNFDSSVAVAEHITLFLFNPWYFLDIKNQIIQFQRRFWWKHRISANSHMVAKREWGWMQHHSCLVLGWFFLLILGLQSVHFEAKQNVAESSRSSSHENSFHLSWRLSFQPYTDLWPVDICIAF